MRKILIVLGLIASIPVFLLGALLARSFILEILGYHVDVPPEELADEIALNNEDPLRCRKLQQTMPTMGPSLTEKRRLCFYLLAQERKDPSICVYLMPSEYGLSCIGEIWGPLIDESNCHWYKSNQVRCFEGKELVPRIYSCELTDMESLPDECIHRIAFKEKNIEECNKIGNASLQAICKTRIAIWNQHPQLRSTIYFNDNIE